MKFCISALALTSLLAASEAGASILSASSQAVREPSAASANWNASTLQHDLNATLEQAAKAAAPVGPVASSPAPASGGLMVNSGATGPSFSPFIESPALDDLFSIPNDQHTIGIARDSWTIGKPDIANQGNGNGKGPKDPDKEKDRDRKRDNPYATPEPSTWMLIGSGLVMLGGYAVVRRRATGLQF